MMNITCINTVFFNRYQIHNFIWDSFYTMSSINPSFLELNEYKLLYFVIDDFTNNLNSLYMADINSASFLFPNIKRNTRHMIEAYLDLYNLCNDKNYINVLKYSSKIYQEKNKKEKIIIPEKYFEHAHKRRFDKKSQKYINPSGTFTIQSKCKISELNGSKWTWEETFKKYCNDCNNYVHPDSFVENLSNNYVDFNLKINELYEYLHLNLNLLISAYNLFIFRFNNNMIPILHCYNCPYNRNCIGCYDGSISQFKYILENNLFEVVSIQDNPNYYK